MERSDGHGYSPGSTSGQGDTTSKSGIDYNTSIEATVSLYQSILADQRQELQKLLDDWSRRQDQIFERILAARESFDQVVPNTISKPFQPISTESDNGSDVVVKSGVQVQASVQGQSPESLLSLRAGGSSIRHSTSFVKEVESGVQFTDDLSKTTGPSRCIWSLMHWCEEKYRQGEEITRDPQNQPVLTQMVLSNTFQSVTGMVILANSIFLGYSSDYAVKNVQEPNTPLMNVVEAAFTLFYAVELLLRIVALGWFFIFSTDWAWNLFDLFLVASSAWGMAQEHIGGTSGGSNSSVLRTARIPKMIRLLRAFRIFKAFRELRLLLNLIVGSMKSLFWACLLICIVAYVCGNVFLQGATAALSKDGSAEDISASDRDQIEKFFPSLAEAMLNLYAAVAGGIDWKDMAMSTLRLGTLYCILYMLYIAFFLFVITNTLTSLFLSTAIKYADSDQQTMIYNELRKKQDHIRKIRAVFRSITKSDRGSITKEDMDTVLQDPKMMAFMSSVEIDSADVEEFFNVLSNDGQQAVDVESFVVGCMKMRGAARSMDLLGLIHRHNTDIVNFQQIEKQLVVLQQSISRLLEQKDTNHANAGTPRAMSV